MFSIGNFNAYRAYAYALWQARNTVVSLGLPSYTPYPTVGDGDIDHDGDGDGAAVMMVVLMVMVTVIIS